MAAPTESEILLARVGRKTFALPLGDVEHILPLDGHESAGADASGVIAYQGEPVTWHPLWLILEEQSSYATLDELQALLPQRRQDHIEWVTALEQSLTTGSPFAKARSPYECAFGKWYYSYQTEDRQLRTLLDKFEVPHARIHGLADEVLGLKDQGRLAEATSRLAEERETTLAQLLTIFDRTLASLPGLKRQQALIVSGHGERHALGIDGVLDIHSVGADRFRPTTASYGRLKPSGFVIGSDGQLIPLLRTDTLIGV